MLLALLALAGCRLDADVATTVAADGSGSVTVTLRADAELVAAVPGLLDDLRADDLRQAGWTVSGPATSPDGGATVTMTKPFATPEQATAVLAEISGPDGPLVGVKVAQEHGFARVTTSVDGHAQLPGLAAFADADLVAALGGVPLADRVTPEQLAAGFGLTVRFGLPGDVVATNGAADGGVVTWQPPMQPGVVTPLQATAEARDRGAEQARDRERWATRALWAWLALAAVALVGAGVVAALVHRHRSRRPPGPPVSPSPPASPASLAPPPSPPS